MGGDEGTGVGWGTGPFCVGAGCLGTTLGGGKRETEKEKERERVGKEGGERERGKREGD